MHFDGRTGGAHPRPHVVAFFSFPYAPCARQSCLHFYERRTLRSGKFAACGSPGPPAAATSDGCARDFNAPLGPHRERKGTLFDVAGAQMCRIKHLAHKTAWRTWRRVCRARCIIAQPTNRRRPPSLLARTHTYIHTSAANNSPPPRHFSLQHLTFIARRNHCRRGGGGPVIASWLFPLAAFCSAEEMEVIEGGELWKSKGAGFLPPWG